MKKVIEGRITSRFGYRTHPVTGQKQSFHNGIDIAAPVGTPVYSPFDGVVASVYNHESGGKTIILKGNNGDRAGFCHLNEQLVKVGQTVSKGSLIAKSGNTGRSTGPHLHFSYSPGRRWNGYSCLDLTQDKYVDPTPYVNIK